MCTPPPVIDQVPCPLILLEYAPPAPYELAEPLSQQMLLPDKSAELTGAADAAETTASDSVDAAVNERRCRFMWCLLISRPNDPRWKHSHYPHFALLAEGAVERGAVPFSQIRRRIVSRLQKLHQRGLRIRGLRDAVVGPKAPDENV